MRTSDKQTVSLITCCDRSFRALSKAAAKSAGARMRSMGLLPTRVNWVARASLCETCPLRRLHRGTSYCGQPFLDKIDRDPTIDGCGCPTRAKAQDPAEHCPVTSRFGAAHTTSGSCDCRWCALAGAA